MDSLIGTGRLNTGPLSTEWVERVAERMKIIGGSTTRIRILMLLERREATVIEIVDELDMLPAAISNNLKLLRMNGLVSARDEGRHVRYALADYTACALLRAASAGTVGHGQEIVELGRPEPA
jgi:DNA-binding transcriptional ArsR family regulator